jgi:acyl-CoA reductase-like NAD-dependent aldehyde dehydrogenase
MSRLISTNPADNYAKVGEVVVSTEDEIKQFVANANSAKTAWKELGVAARIKLLEPILSDFHDHIEEIAELISLETGKSINESRTEVSRYTDSELAWFLENGAQALADQPTLHDDESYHRIKFEPHGVAAVIAPWNFPFGMAVWGIFPNLIAGNTVVFKTSEECPLVGKKIEEIIKRHDLPDGVFSEIYGAGAVGQKLAECDVDLIWFTGSTRTGKLLYKLAADKFIKVILEMGGSNPCVVFDDADISEVVPVIFKGRFQHNGQVCSALKRLIVHESIADKLTSELGEIIKSLKVGNPLDPTNDLGSLVAKRQKDLVEEQLDDALAKGAKIIASADLPAGLQGAFVAPTLIKNITKDMRVWREEVFGPVFPVVTFKTEKEAVELANDTEYGLGSRVISDDTVRAERIASQINAGSVSLNCEARFAPCDPFGGYKLSGMGRERGVLGLRELCQVKVIQSQLDQRATLA